MRCVIRIMTFFSDFQNFRLLITKKKKRCVFPAEVGNASATACVSHFTAAHLQLRSRFLSILSCENYTSVFLKIAR